jgi:hypothetical protein
MPLALNENPGCCVPEKPEAFHVALQSRPMDWTAPPQATWSARVYRIRSCKRRYQINERDPGEPLM